MSSGHTSSSQIRYLDTAIGSATGRTAGLLVSVRDRDELLEVLSLPVDIVDLKEPNRGPLAAADATLWNYADQTWRERGHLLKGEDAGLPFLSAALGESEEALQVAGCLPGQFRFAKVGPHRCASMARLREVWDRVGKLLPTKTELVGVAYADHVSAESLEPEAVFRLAASSGLRRCLVDTFSKDGRSTVELLGWSRLEDLHALAQELGLWWTLAGSIRSSVLNGFQDRGWIPNCFGVRGDVCEGERTSRLSKAGVMRWAEQLDG